MRKLIFLMIIVSMNLTLKATGDHSQGNKQMLALLEENAQQNVVRGKITDEEGVPLPGVTIRISGTNVGTTTDIDGNYTLEGADANAVLVYSYIGYRTLEIMVDGRTEIDVTMEEETLALDEVVVVGYGEMSRERLTTSISTLDPRTMDNAAIANPGTALQGTIPGLRVMQNSGQPGRTPIMTLRGGTTITTGTAPSPLILVDGVNRSMEDINPADIESISVLKDAASTAIYGARANAGVILITTKRGKHGIAEVEYTGRSGVNSMREDYNMVNAVDYEYYYLNGMYHSNAAYVEGGFGTMDPDNHVPNRNPDTRWQTDLSEANLMRIKIVDSNRHRFSDYVNAGWEWLIDPYWEQLDGRQDTIMVLDNQGALLDQAFNYNAITQDHSIRFSGGDERARYSSNIGYYSEEGLAKNTMYSRFYGSLNGSYNIRDNLDISGAVSYSFRDMPDNIFNDAFYRARIMQPHFLAYLPDGSPNPGNSPSYGNIAYYEDKYIRIREVERTTLNAAADWEIAPDLRLNLTGNLYITNSKSENFNKGIRYRSGATVESRPAYAGYSRGILQQHNVSLNYAKSFNGHNASLLIGGEYYDQQSFSLSASGQGAPTDDIHTLNAVVERTAMSSSISEYRMLSSFSRLNYDYEGRYLLTFATRYDGTSSLADYRWGFFPGISAGWNIHAEDFFQASPISNYISFIKPRASYGVNGNIAGIGRYEVQGTYGAQTIYGNASAYLNTELINQALRWEKSKTIDAGVEFGVFNNRATFVVNYYRRVNEDLLTNVALPYYTGFSSLRTNLGSLENKGLELEMALNVLSLANGLSWDLGFNAASVKNTVLSLPVNPNERNRQGGTQIYDPDAGEVIWVGGYQEGRTLGEIVAHPHIRILEDWDDIYEHAAWRYDAIANLYGPELYASIPEDERYGKFPITPGDMLWKDLDGNDTINMLDREVVGNIFPNWTGGFNTSISFRNFTVYGRFDFALGHSLYNEFAIKSIGCWVGSMGIIDWVHDSWTPDNNQATYPKFSIADLPSLNYKRSAMHTSTIDNHSGQFYEKADYLAVRELTLSYRLPESVIGRLGLSQIRANLSGQNLHYFTKEYTGWNPEQGGIDGGRYPLPRRIVFGLTVTL